MTVLADEIVGLAGAFADARQRRYPRGSLVFAEGDEAHEVLLIASGSVKVTVSTPDGKQVVLDVLDAGALLGELSAVDGAARSAAVVALTPVEVLAISRTEFRRRLCSDAELAGALLDVMAARLRAAARRQLELGAADALGRVCLRLLDLADRYSIDDGDGTITIAAPLTQLDLAEWSGLSREAVVKALRALRTLNWIRIAGREIVVLDRPAIEHRSTT